MRLLGSDIVGKDITLDTDGKPVGGKLDPSTGKDGGNIGQEPYPVAPPIVIPTPVRVVTQVRGQFCPKATNHLTVLFVVDYSGSMGRHIPASGQPENPGHDPQINGSCGRLRAAQAIIADINASRSPGDQIDVGMVPFAGGIVTNKFIQIQSLDSFAAQVSKDSFCQYVVQDPSFGYDPQNPGGIDGPQGILGIGQVDASTNYRAAFTAAESLLGRVYGRKVAYFISDGEPTSGGSDPVQAGIDAGRSMRDHIDNFTLNGLLLGNEGAAAQDVLVQVTGSADRVRMADNADDLAKQIMSFTTAAIDETSGDATLSVAPYPTAEIGLHYLGQDASHPGIWQYETQPFVLLGNPGTTTLNIVDVTARGQDGSTYRSTVTIRYTP